jgi:hypothetical protein
MKKPADIGKFFIIWSTISFLAPCTVAFNKHYYYESAIYCLTFIASIAYHIFDLYDCCSMFGWSDECGGALSLFDFFYNLQLVLSLLVIVVYAFDSDMCSDVTKYSLNIIFMFVAFALRFDGIKGDAIIAMALIMCQVWSIFVFVIASLIIVVRSADVHSFAISVFLTSLSIAFLMLSASVCKDEMKETRSDIEIALYSNWKVGENINMTCAIFHSAWHVCISMALCFWMEIRCRTFSLLQRICCCLYCIREERHESVEIV